MDRREQEPPPLGPGGAAWQALGAARERAGFFLQRSVIWPIEDRTEALGRRGRIGFIGGGGVAVAAVAAALVIGLSGGSGSDEGTTAVAVVQQASTPHVAPTPAPKPKKAAPTKPSGPTLHGAPPDFAPAQNVKAGVGNNEALGGAAKQDLVPGGAPAERGTAGGDAGGAGAIGGSPSATASDAPAATAKIGATPAASAAAQADDRATGGAATSAAPGTGAAAPGITTGNVDGTGTGDDAADSGFNGPPAPKAAKQTARRFAQAFVVYEVGGVDGKVRRAFGRTSTEQLSKSLLHRPPRQPADVKVPKAKVVNVVAGPSKGSVYTVSVSLLRVGVTSELRLQLEQGPGKKWQVTDVLG